MNKNFDYQKLSKEVSYVLRHAPWEYELELDEHGWISVEQLLNSLNQTPEWENITLDDLNHMIQYSAKKRHEIKNRNIRAFYGHSIPMIIKKERSIPPKVLYHGTANKFLESIKQEGLIPMDRQHVHLSEDIETATLVGKRKENVPVILTIDTEAAVTDGINFYLGNEKVWLADPIPAKYISIQTKS